MHLKTISKEILSDIDQYCLNTYDKGHRKHLGASITGHDCNRYLWYVFRWCFTEKTTGRQQRLFNRGHHEEKRFIEWLKGIGFEINNEANSEQFASINDHFGGTVDGLAWLPKKFEIKEQVLLEFKTNGTGKGFSDLLERGVQIAKPVHWSQICIYGYKLNIKYVLYLCINKNDDDIHIELLEIDHNHGRQMETKAEKIIFSDTPPPRLSENPTYFKCKWCPAFLICHENTSILKNCRSCTFAKPVENAEWYCDYHKSVIPENFIPTGCEHHSSINVTNV